jgi:hypothetical protein
VNDQHSQGTQLQRVCEAQEKRMLQLENKCRDLEQAFSQKMLGPDYGTQCVADASRLACFHE